MNIAAVRDSLGESIGAVYALRTAALGAISKARESMGEMSKHLSSDDPAQWQAVEKIIRAEANIRALERLVNNVVHSTQGDLCGALIILSDANPNWNSAT